MGARIEVPLSGKFAVNLTGDVGGWGVGSQLDYQVAGVLGFKMKENMTLRAGYRYLDVNYRATRAKGLLLFDTAMSGITFGVTMDLK